MSVGERIASRLADVVLITEVRDLAKVGARTPDVIRDQVGRPEVRDAAMVLLAVGNNDVRRWRRRPGQLAAETRELLERVRAAAPDALVVHVGAAPFDTSPIVPRPLRPLVRARIAAVNREISAACRLAGVLVVDLPRLVRHEFADRRDLFSRDGFHVNVEGYELCARVICDQVIEQLPAPLAWGRAERSER